MKILFLVPYAPTSIRTRPYNLLKNLVLRGHNITLATLYENEPERQALNELAALGLRVIAFPLTRPRIALNLAAALPSPEPLQARYSWHPALARRLLHELQTAPYHLLHIEHLRGARYGLYLSQFPISNFQFRISNFEFPLSPSQFPISNFEFQISNFEFPIIFDSVDCISHLFAQAARRSRSRFGRWVTRFELPRTRRFEARLLQTFPRTLITSPVDAAALQNTLPAGRRTPGTLHPPEILPNGVDLDYFTPAAGPDPDPNAVVFTGKLSYHANVTMALYLLTEIMPLVWEKQPAAHLYLVGKDPHPALLRYRGLPSVTVTGTVPDLRPYLHRAAAALVPLLYGAGIQNKILEALACGAPVVATPQAVSALDAVPGRDLLVASGAPAFAAAVLRLLTDPGLRARLGRAGRRYVETCHTWPAITHRLETIYREVTNDR